MNKNRKLQDYAEDFNSSQSDDMEVLPQGDGSSDEMAKAVKQIAAAADNINKHAETIGLAVDGIGRYLLNEDGTYSPCRVARLTRPATWRINAEQTSCSLFFYVQSLFHILLI